MSKDTVEQIIERQGSWGPFVVMGLNASMTPEQRAGARQVLGLIDGTLADISDPVVAKTLLESMLKSIRVELGAA